MSRSLEDHLELFRNQRAKIDDSLVDVSRSPRLSKREAWNLARSRGADELTLPQLTYMVHLYQVRPEVVSQGDRDIHLYGRDQIRDIILNYRLREKHKLDYSQIASIRLLDGETARQSKIPGPTSGEVGLPSQHRRGIFTLRSRIVGVVLNWLFDQHIEPGVILHFRQRVNPGVDPPTGTPFTRPLTVGFRWMDHPEAADFVGDFRSKDLLGFVTPDNEVIFSGLEEYQGLYHIAYSRWLLIEVESDQPYRHYELTIGLPNEALCERFCQPGDALEQTILAFLLDAVALEIDDQGPVESDADNSDVDYSTLLQSVAEKIPDLSPLWQYCVVLTRDSTKPGHLRIVAKSRHFPFELPSNTTIQVGHLLAGWAYKWDYPIVINETIGRADPRLQYQAFENASAAIAIPAHTRDHCNGVVYIGTCCDLSNQIPFGEEAIKVLRILANIVGEMIEKNRMRNDSERMGFEIISRPSPVKLPWSELNGELHRAIASIDDLSGGFNENENLHLTLIQIEDFAKLRSDSPTIAEWVAEHVLNTTFEHYLRHTFPRPQVFLRQTNSLEEFVCFVPRLVVTDEADRAQREHLRDLQNSIYLPTSGQKPNAVRVYVWSMPFRVANLRQAMSRVENPQITVDVLTREIIGKVEEALVTLPYGEVGHQYEARGDYASALDQYLAALHVAPGNSYWIRHVAKMHFALGHFKEAAARWNQLVEKDPFSKHYLRYGYVLAAQGEFEAANYAYAKAHKLDPNDPTILLEWGDLLLAHEKPDPAIEKYEHAISLVDQRDTLWLRLAEAYLMKGSPEFSERAESYIRMVLNQWPNHPRAKLFLLRTQEWRRQSDENDR